MYSMTTGRRQEPHHTYLLETALNKRNEYEIKSGESVERGSESWRQKKVHVWGNEVIIWQYGEQRENLSLWHTLTQTDYFWLRFFQGIESNIQITNIVIITKKNEARAGLRNKEHEQQWEWVRVRESERMCVFLPMQAVGRWCGQRERLRKRTSARLQWGQGSEGSWGTRQGLRLPLPLIRGSVAGPGVSPTPSEPRMNPLRKKKKNHTYNEYSFKFSWT